MAAWPFDPTTWPRVVDRHPGYPELTDGSLVHLPERSTCRNRHYSSLPCRRMAATAGATGPRRNSADSSQPPRAIECSHATAHTSAGSITSATSATQTTPTRSSSAVAVSSPGGGVSFPSARCPKSDHVTGRLWCAAPARSDPRTPYRRAGVPQQKERGVLPGSCGLLGGSFAQLRRNEMAFRHPRGQRHARQPRGTVPCDRGQVGNRVVRCRRLTAPPSRCPGCGESRTVSGRHTSYRTRRRAAGGR